MSVHEAGSVSDGPLSGIHVLEFATPLSAAYCGMHLADLGATVIKIEPPGGSEYRAEGAVVEHFSKLCQWLDRGKRSVVIDMQRADGRAVADRLVRQVDVVVTNLHASADIAIEYERLASLNPQLVYAEITGFGLRGPMAGRLGSDGVAQAYGGSLAANGKLEHDGSPGLPRLAAAELPAGIATAIGIGAALVNRQRSGQGEHVEVSLLRVAMSMNYFAAVRDAITDAYHRDPIVEQRARVRSAGGSYADLAGVAAAVGATRSYGGIYWSGYRAADGGMVFGALTPANREAFRQVLGITDDPMDREGFDIFDAKNADRAAALKQRVRQQLLTKTVAEWVALCDGAGAPAAPVNFPEDLDEDEQAQLHMVSLEHPAIGPQSQVRPIADLALTPSGVGGPAPSPGEHTDGVLSAVARMSGEEIATLREREVVQ